MGDPETYFPVRPSGREDRTGRTVSDVVGSSAAHGRASADSRQATHGRAGRREDDDRGEGERELLPAPWGDDGNREPEDLVPRVFAPLQYLRPSRDSNETTHDRINWAIHAAYTTPDSVWRKANVLYAYTIGPVLIASGDTIRWVGGSLARFLGALVIVPALLFVLNQIPLLDLLILDELDVSNLFPHEDPETVVVPIVPPPADGG